MNTRKSKLVGTKKPLVKANNGIISKNDPRYPKKQLDEPKPNPNPYSRPGTKDIPSVKPTSPIGSRLVPLGTNEPKGPKTPMDVINKDTKNPGKLGQFINRIKANRLEKKEEKLRLEEYKKKPRKMESYKVGGMANSNARVLADKTPGSKGTKVGLNKRVPKPGKKC